MHIIFNLYSTVDAFTSFFLCSGPNPTQPTENPEYSTQPNPWMDPTHVQHRRHYGSSFSGARIWLHAAASSSSTSSSEEEQEQEEQQQEEQEQKAVDYLR